MDSELKQLEEELSSFAPSPISSEVLARMVEAMDRWEQQEGVNHESLAIEEEGGAVVPFRQESEKANWRPMWAAAAAVAVLGAVTGLVLPEQSTSPVVALAGLGPVPLLRQASLVPVNVQRKVRTVDAGVVSNQDGVEYQLLRIVRQDEADFRGKGIGEDNVGLKISRPQIDYFVVPVSY